MNKSTTGDSVYDKGTEITVNDETEIEESFKKPPKRLSSLKSRPEVVQRLLENYKKAIPQNQHGKIQTQKPR